MCGRPGLSRALQRALGPWGLLSPYSTSIWVVYTVTSLPSLPQTANPLRAKIETHPAIVESPEVRELLPVSL